MDYITDKITYPIYTSKAFDLYFGDMKLGVLDIETTGLSPRHSQFVLGGLLTVENGALQVRQFFAEDLKQEREALQAYLEAIGKADFLLTYNGQKFDLPFIRERTKDAPPKLPFNLDLYLLVKNYSPVRKFLPNLKQKTVENFLGLWDHRKDEISGAESVELYYQYLSQKEPYIKEKILLHNHDDVLQLYRLLAVLEKADLHRALFHMGFPVKSDGTGALIVEKIGFSGNQLIISGRQLKGACDYKCFEWGEIPCSADFSRQKSIFSVSVPLIKHSGLILVDLAALKMDLSVFEKYPGCQEGFLILEQQGEKHYLEINHFVKVFLERMLNQWIIRP
ncbi:ribonuclease H-like domain-containing protein [Anaerovorax odorimutans]|uniref:Ribonuclease H-like domain-containing protein n=1 Tax=Anaerovorax odorimutans TaxID=109327 RepID=A0ABT1RJP2_9FIRM|nr:ribonuclease H-like domain-containing protein [Anaerovorax odorimutans]MCQ4635388.1 ribonuclease H-like domain-containing protein [Anaerovorax odorimutans]